MLDFPLTAFLNFSNLELVIFALLVIPTVYVMITGAPFVPTQMVQVERMIKAAKLKPGMKVYDLGSGDGRLVYKAAKEHGCDAIGYEYSPMIWAWSQLLALFFWRSKAKLHLGDLWKKDLSDADVIFCYLLPHMMKQMQSRLFPKLKPGTLIVSHAFAIPDLKPWKEIPRDSERKLGPVRVYKI